VAPNLLTAGPGETIVKATAPEPIRIWIVEDELMIAKALQQGLGHLGHSVTHIVPGNETELDEPLLPRPDLALVDLDPSGTQDRHSRIALAKKLRETSNVPTIFVSSDLDDELVLAADAVEPFGYLQKPVTERELKLTIDLATRRAMAERELRERNLQQDALTELEQLALADSSLDSLLEEAVRVASRTMGTRYARALRFLPESDCLLLTHGIGWKPGMVGTYLVNSGRGSLSGYAIEQKQPVISVDLKHETRFFVPPVLREHGIISSMTTVVWGPSGPYGTLGIDSDQPRMFTYNEIQFLQSLSSLLSQCIWRLSAELHVKEQEVYAQALLDNAATPFFSLDFSGRICGWNRASEELFGWTAEDIVGHGFAETLLSRGARSRYRELATRLSTESLRRLFNKRRLELPLIDKRGKKVSVEASFFSLRRNDEFQLNAYLMPISIGTESRPHPRRSGGREPSSGSARPRAARWSESRSSKKRRAHNA
jgi:PAS domain S-box-containing protein